MARTRLVTLDDAGAVGDLFRTNRAFLAPFEPHRDEEYYTERGQRRVIGRVLEDHARGFTVPRVILDDDGVLVGRITVTAIERGPFQSCRLGYLVSEHANGRGIATGAVAEVVAMAFDDLGLHRVEAATLLHNARSQRVLERNGFVRIGVAPAYLRIAGEWRDHLMFQRISA